ncbi:hypothetical protein [Chitinophaga sp. 212800010-3]|uniref:hypothetical protein n=1 Tax=unclassified Chitinophaga TaxID=2619133 RepID=UPI002DE8C772|nr:hypothetical protein [Chitinophaga sp. 212800010-3]
MSLLCFEVHAQQGFSCYPLKVYFEQGPGAISRQKITLINPGEKEMQIAVSVGNWLYDSIGRNIFPDTASSLSCQSWIKLLPGGYIAIPPASQRELTIELTTPDTVSASRPFHTAIVFLTQLITKEKSGVPGAAIDIAVRAGIKIYNTAPSFPRKNEIELLDFTRADKTMEISFRNKSPICTDGKVKFELLNMKTGQTQQIGYPDFYTLPGNFRRISCLLPATLSAGHYMATAIIYYGLYNEVKLAELEFDY